jgi:hypothetical protein
MSTPHSHWSTNSRYAYGFREAGQLTLIFHRGVFILLSDKVLPIEASSLEEAIAAADAHVPPPGWSFVVGMWLHPGWKVLHSAEEDGWVIHSDQGKRMSKQVFKRADLARKWCEVRQDRVGLNLRGPKPRQEGPDGREAEEAV